MSNSTKISQIIHEGKMQFALLHRNWLISTAVKFTLLFILLGIGILLFRWQTLPTQVPLWYAKPWGIDRLASPIYLWLLPLGSLLWFIVDIALALYLAQEYFIFIQLLFIASTITSLLACISLIKIIFLVT